MNHIEKLREFTEKIGISFKDISILQQAFTHRSYLNENRDYSIPHNERLEFLGDAVLELVTTDYLFNELLDKPEGELTAIRAALVNTNSISDAAKRLGAEDYLLLSKGEARDTGRARQYILANVYEAIIGAIYLDQGYAKARDFIESTLLPSLDEILKEKLWLDAKSYFQEKAQENENKTPTYKTLTEDGPDHAKMFTVAVFIGQDKVAEGTGMSKQEAEQSAARSALKTKGWE